MKIFTRKFYFLSAVLGLLTLVSVIAIRCKKPTEGIVVTVNTSDLFHYTALIQVVDASGAVPNNLSVAVTGTNAAAIYGIDGKKALAAPAGIIALAVHPKMEPTATTPLKFNISITGPGYLPLIIPVSISVDQKSQVIKASILNLTVPTAGVASATTTATATGGTVTSTTTLSTPATSGPEATTVTIPAGTKVQDVNGNVINASSISVSANNFNTSQPGTIALFPGSSLASTNVVNASGTTVSSVLVPAGFVNIDMTAGGTAVKKFSSPINLSMALDPGYKDPSTGNVLVAGSQLGIYSYDTGTGQWKFEQNATVVNQSGKLVVNFTSSHLTIFTACVALNIIPQLKANITAPWYQNGTASNINVVATINNGPNYSIYQQTFQLDSLLTFVFDNKLPSPTPTNPVTLNFYSSTNALLGTAVITGSVTSFNVTLTQPSTNPEVTLLLKLDCTQAKQHAIVTPPDFYLLYKPAGQSASNYTLLGQVKGGTLTTTQLLPAPTAYDFKAVLNSNVKEVFSHTVAENIPANQTVGGTSFNGKTIPAQNQIDIKALCESLP